MSVSLPIIDAHQHFWNAGIGMHAAAFLPEDYDRALAGGCLDLRATVFVECLTAYDESLPHDLRPTGETRFAAAIGAAPRPGAPRYASAVIAYADPLARGTPFGEVLDAHAAAAGGRLRGIRRCAAWDEDPSLTYAVLETRRSMLLEPAVATAARDLASRGLLFETWLYHPQIDDLAALAAAVPDCTFVLDHGGTPLGAGRHAGLDPAPAWREGVSRLAALSNVVVKLGGLISPGTALDRQRAAHGLDQWTRAALAEALDPWVRHLVAAFGADRCLFETNFPIDALHCDLQTLIGAYLDVLAPLSLADRRAILAGNAARLYRIPLEAEERP